MMTLFYRSLPRGKGMMDDSLESVGISVWGVRRSGIGQRRLSGIMGNIQSICFSMYYMTCFFYHLFFTLSCTATGRLHSSSGFLLSAFTSIAHLVCFWGRFSREL